MSEFKTVNLQEEKVELSSFLVLGVEKSGKTWFCGTAPRPMLHYCFDGGSYKVFLGQEGITPVLAQGVTVVNKLEREMSSLLIKIPEYTWPNGKTEKYKSICFDPYSFHSDDVMEDVESKGGDGYSLYRNIMKNHKRFLNMVEMLSKQVNVIVTSHIEIKQDDTTGQKMFLADLNGKTRNSIGAKFDGVGFTKVVPRGGGKTDYYICPVPDSQHKAGIRVPMGCPNVFSNQELPDFMHIQKRYQEAVKNKVQSKENK